MTPGTVTYTFTSPKAGPPVWLEDGQTLVVTCSSPGLGVLRRSSDGFATWEDVPAASVTHTGQVQDYRYICLSTPATPLVVSLKVS